MFSLFRNLFCREPKQEEFGGELSMVVLSPEKEKNQTSTSMRTKNIILRRAGKDIFIIDGRHSRLLSQATLEHLTNSVSSTQTFMKIRTLGLSRAQVGKIAGSFLSTGEDNNITVEIQQIPGRTRHSILDKSSHQTQCFEILVKGGDDIVNK